MDCRRQALPCAEPKAEFCSDLGRTAIDEQLDPVNVSAVVGRQEYRRLAEIVRRADPAERNGSDGLGLLLIRQKMGEAGSRRVTGAQYVDPDVASLQVDDPAVGK